MSADLSGANIDLADPQSWNAYAYVNGDPIDFTDPSGEGFWSKLLGIGLSIAGFFTGGTTTLLGTILTTSGSALTGASLALGQPSVSGTPPFNPSAQGAPVGVFGTPPFGGTGNSPIPTGGVFQPPVIVQPQLIFDAQAPYITGVINAYERALPSWLPTWARTLLVGIFSDPTPGLFAMEVPIPGRPFIGANAAKRAFEQLDEFHGVDPATASNRLHKLKARGRLGPADNVTIGRTGDVYDAKTGRWLGTLTDKSLGK